jgi:uracil-DNA glycosylase
MAMSKEDKLQQLQKEMEEHTSLPLTDSANLVFGEGNSNTSVLFIGEAPGFHEDRLGRPFVGLAGKLLDTLLEELGWPRESVYITNIVKRRPPQNRDPSPQEINAYKPYLQKQIDIIEPTIIAPLGRFSMNYFLPDAKISKTHGKLMRAKPYLVYPLYHPAAALRSTTIKEELRKDFLRLPEAIVRIQEMPINTAFEKGSEHIGPAQDSLFSS